MWECLRFKDRYARTGEPFSVRSWTHFVSKPLESSDKSAVPIWLPITSENHQKRIEGVRSLCALVLDYDKGDTPMKSLERFWAPYVNAVHTSYSHAEEKPKLRVILPYAPGVSVTVLKHGEMWRWAWKRTKEAIDRQAKNCNRIWYWPSCPDASRYRWSVNAPRDGVEFLDPKETFAPLPPPPPVPSYINHSVLAQDADKEMHRRFKHDPDLRMVAAQTLGAKIVTCDGALWAKGLRCQCGRPSLCFIINPHSMTSAHCDHKNSCGYSVPVYHLLQTH